MCILCYSRVWNNTIIRAEEDRAEDRHNPDPPSDWEAAEEANLGEDRVTRVFYGAHNEASA